MAGPSWRAGFSLPPEAVPSSAMAPPMKRPTSQGTAPASRGTLRQSPMVSTITNMLTVSVPNSWPVVQPAAGWSTA